MTVELPKVIAAYFAADKIAEAKALSECFTSNATVKDEGNTYTGRDAICRWMENASTTFTYTVEPFDLEEGNGKFVVYAHLVGDFPGSPLDLRYFFIIHQDKISELEIIL